ncbi:MAG: hypothetical protein OXI20_08645 [Rhodospirillales bacterium]|nr:hypothetical protein [Rhodospirillales bacterium]
MRVSFTPSDEARLWEVLDSGHPRDFDNAMQLFDQLAFKHRAPLVRTFTSKCYEGVDIDDCIQTAFEKINRAIATRMGFVEAGSEPAGPPATNLKLFKLEYGFRAFASLVVKDVVRTENRRPVGNRNDDRSSVDLLEVLPSEEGDVATDLLRTLTPIERFIVSCSFGIPAHITLNRQGVVELMVHCQFDDEAVPSRACRFKDLDARPEKLTQRQIAFLLDCSPRTVRRQLAAAIEHMQAQHLSMAA